MWREKQRVRLSHKRICEPYQLFDSTLCTDRTARPGAKVVHSLQIATASPFRGDLQTLSVVQCYLFCETFSTVLCLCPYVERERESETKPSKKDLQTLSVVQLYVVSR